MNMQSYRDVTKDEVEDLATNRHFSCSLSSSSSSSSSEEEENAKFKYCATVKFGDCNNDERRSSIAGSIIPLSVLPPVEAVLRLLEVRCGERLVIII